MIAATPLGPILDRPVADVLVGLGLPGLPEIPPLPPLPGLPPLPTVDLGLLVKPITDLLGGFGTGDLATADFDPTMVFDGLSTVLETSMTMAQSALELADTLWVGQSSIAAAAKTGEASVNSGQLSAQGTGISFDIQTAAGIVAAGLAAVQAILAATVGKMLAAVPLIPSGAGLPLVTGFAAEGLSEATAAVAVTRAQLLAPTTHMTVNGVPVPVTAAPTAATGAAAQSPFAVAATVLDAIAPMVSTATELPSMLVTPMTKMLAADETTLVRPGDRARTDDPDGAGGGPPTGAGTVPVRAAAGGGGGSLGVAAGVTAPLGAARTPVPGGVGATEPASYTPGPSARGASVAATPVPASMAPVAAAGAARGLGGEGHHEVPDYLVTEDNGRDLVGATPGVAPPVLGDDATDAPPEPMPDIRLRLGPDGPTI
ncbi:hypothetical protein [Gordonia sp. NPDC003376]